MENKEKTFNTIQEKMDRLDKIIVEIQSDKCSLEDKISLYKEGKKLISELDSRFNEARKEIEKISDK